jgi:urease accessory protein
MCDGASRSDAAFLQRAVGELRVSVRRRDANTVLEGLRQYGCLKARFPRALSPGWFDILTLNTSGGIAGGDRLSSVFQVAAGARATIAATAAERFYRSLRSDALPLVRNRIEVAAGASAEWLPQETILFDHGAIDRRLEVDLAADAWFLGVESLVFGRAMMGERVTQGRLRDVIRIRRAGCLLLHDAIRLDGHVDEMLQRRAVGKGARAMATLVHAAPDAEATLRPVREALADTPAECAASAWDGMLVARFLAADGALLRRAVIAALGVLRAPRPLPRVWVC